MSSEKDCHELASHCWSMRRVGLRKQTELYGGAGSGKSGRSLEAQSQVSAVFGILQIMAKMRCQEAVA